MTGSDAWKSSGTDIKSSAGDNIKQAFEDFKAQGQSDSDTGFVNKASQAADQGELKKYCRMCRSEIDVCLIFPACPQTGDGVGGTNN
jgi:hypothetical protein